MNVNIETPSTLRRKLTIELEPGEINSELDRTYNELRRSVQMRGFRPGHAPRSLLERFFGDQVRGDVTDLLIHADLAGNVLFADGMPPAVIDFSPLERPAGLPLGSATGCTRGELPLKRAPEAVFGPRRVPRGPAR